MCYTTCPLYFGDLVSVNCCNIFLNVCDAEELDLRYCNLLHDIFAIKMADIIEVAKKRGIEMKKNWRFE